MYMCRQISRQIETKETIIRKKTVEQSRLAAIHMDILSSNNQQRDETKEWIRQRQPVNRSPPKPVVVHESQSYRPRIAPGYRI